LKKTTCLAYIILVPASLIILAFGVFWLAWTNSYVICFGTPFPTFASVEDNAYFKFPPSARSIEYDANGVNRKAGCTIWVKFEIDGAELTTFVATTEVPALSANVPSSEGGFGFFMDKQGWTLPARVLASHTPLDAKNHVGFIYADQWIVVDVADSERNIVYLIVNYEWL
jgi:hypothetical protein